MNKWFSRYLFFFLVFFMGCNQNNQPSMEKPPGADYDGQAFTFQEVGDGIYHIKGTGVLSVGCNSTLIVNERDAVLVDSHISPAAMWALFTEMTAITDKPIRYVINTHFHFDHVHGNQMFPEDVKIISHTYTRDMIAAGNSKRGRSYDAFIGRIPDRISELEQQLAAATDDSTKSVFRDRIRLQKNYKEATDAVMPRAPNERFTERLQYKFGDRLIQILFFGRGHTGGDAVVFLPEEKILITGDLLSTGISYLGDAYPEEWVRTLEKLKKLDFETILPGHGDLIEDREKIDHFQAYLTDFWKQAVQMRKDGVEADEAAKRIDMTAHASHYPRIKEAGVSIFGVQRVYELMEGTAK